MQDLTPYQKSFIVLAQQLEKLLKVIKHSDPTAKVMQKTLYSKYLSNVEQLARLLRGSYLWQDIRDYIESLQGNQGFPVDRDVQEIILKKLTSDLENQLTIKPEFSEFSPVAKPRTRRKSKKIKAKNLPLKEMPRSKDPPIYTRENLMEMVHLSQQQRKARADLRMIIERINQLDPERIEIKINQHIKNERDQ